MKLGQIYKTAVELGIKKDPRGKDGIDRLLSDAAEEYKGLKGDKKRYFDKERLSNPFADTRILNGNPELEVKSAFAGIDVETPEIILVDRLREKGKKIDLCISHHPEGRALSALADVMSLQADVWAKYGVPVNVGDALISERMQEIKRAFLPQNHQRPVQAASLLNVPFMCVHTPADNLVTDFLTRAIARAKPTVIGDLADLLLTVPEYRKSAEQGMAPSIMVGDKRKRAGEILVDMTGGTEGPEASIEKLAHAGVGTIVAMHMGEKLRKEAEKQHVNVVIAGHISSDNIGINLFLDQLEKRGVTCSAFSGLERVSRLKG